jgi:ElaB/YqjD/DUF883 family membrane-anchored ribosome-binding protein
VQTYTTPTGNGPTTADSGSTAEQAKEKAKEQAQQAAGQAKGAMRSQVDQRSTQAGERASSLASDVRTISQQLREQGKDQPAQLADKAAERAERLGGYLQQSDADRILQDIEDFGRRQPWAIIAGGAAIGFLASRFLKASSTTRYEQRSWQSSRQLPARTTDVSPTASGIHTAPVSTAPPIPTTPPTDTTLSSGLPTGTPGATAPSRSGTSDFEGSR